MKAYTIALPGGEKETIEGRRIRLEGVPDDIVLFYHRDHFYNFRISEASTGYAITPYKATLAKVRNIAYTRIKKIGIDGLKAAISAAREGKYNG